MPLTNSNVVTIPSYAVKSAGGSLIPYLPVTTGLSYAYSFRQVLETAVYCIRIRRSSDNAELDIGFGADRWIDQSAVSTFCGASTGYLQRFYNQAGGGKDYQELTAGEQPVVWNGSAFILGLAGQPSANIDVAAGRSITDNGFTYTADQTAFMLVKDFDGTGSNYGGYYFGFFNLVRFYYDNNSGSPVGRFTFDDGSGSTVVAQNFSQFYQDSYLRFRINETGGRTWLAKAAKSDLTTESHNGTYPTARSGGANALFYSLYGTGSAQVSGKLSEILIYNAALSDSDFALVEANHTEIYGVF